MKKYRKAVAMIELIFAIVVMGIAMLAIPMITTQSSRSVESAMMQESISTVASQIQMIMTRHWDANNEDPALGSYRPILKTNSAFFANRGGLNIGMEGRTNISNTGVEINATSSGDFNDTGLNDIDDYNGVSTLLSSVVASTTGAGDYIDKSMKMTSSINYISDAILLGSNTTFDYNPSGAISAVTTNIKRISITLTSTEPAFADKNITLNAFSCNIGTANLEPTAD